MIASDPMLTLIIPAYNEAARIAQTVSEARTYLDDKKISFEIIVSADGTDGTREKVAELGRTDSRIRVMGREERGGKGRGIREAVAVARGQIIGFSDADNKTPITELDKIWPLLIAGSPAVIACRADKRSRILKHQPWFRRIGSKGFQIFMHTVIGLRHISDTQCGFKFFAGALARAVFSRQKIDGYMFDVEVLYLIDQGGYRIEQVPIDWRDDGDTRLNLVLGNLRNLIDIFKIKLFARWRRLPALSEHPNEQPV